jgi:hypothetical protein
LKWNASLICVLFILVVCPGNLLAYSLTGTVHGGSAVLLNAQVQLYSTSTNLQVGGTATTDGFGHYAITNVADGSYKLFIMPPDGSGFNDAWITDPAITVSGADAVRDVTLLAPTPSISGVVKNSAGTGASNIQVCAQPSSGYNKCVTSDATGAYSITGLNSGTYRLDVAGGYDQVYAASNVPTPSGFRITGYAAAVAVTGAVTQNVTLPFVTLSGKTTDSNGAAVAGVTITVPYTDWSAYGVSYTCRNDNYYSYRVVSDASGEYSMVLLPYNNYSVSLAPPGGSAVIATTIAPLDASATAVRNLALKPAYSISGLVKNPAGTGASNIQVCAQPSSGYSKCAASDATGAYSITGLDTGTYRLDVAGGYDELYVTSNVPTPSGFRITGYAAAVAVSGAVTQNVTLPFVTLSGKTTDSSGAAVAGVTIAVPSTTWSANGVSYTCRNDNYYSYRLVSDATASYSMVLLPYNNYSVSLAPPAGVAVIATTLTPLDASATAVRNLALKPAYSISGLVKSPAGTGASNIQVCAVPVSGYTKCATSDATGAYSIGGLDSGTYRLDVVGGYDQLYAASNVPTPSVFRITGYAAAVAVTGAVTQNVTLPFVTLSGKTTDSNGAPVAGVVVSVPYTTWSANGVSYTCRNDNSFTYRVVSDASGNYSMVLLPYNGYSVSLSPPAGAAVIATTITPLDASATAVKNLALKPAYSISGVVKSPSGTGASNIQVCAQPLSDYGKCAVSDATGAYSIGGLDSGTYRLDVAGGYDQFYAASNVPTPSAFRITGYVAAVAVSGAVTQNVTLPFVTLSGKTTDSNGAAVAGVAISVPYTTWSANGTSYTCRNDNYYSYRVVSDAWGSYSMVLLSYNGYSVSLSPPVGAAVMATTITPLDASATAVRNLALKPAYSISGVVKNPAGTGASNIQVCAQPSSGYSKCATSDATGAYSIGGLDSGTYRLDVLGGYDQVYAASNVPTPSGFKITGYVAALAVTGAVTQNVTLPFVTLSGKTTDSNGAAVAGVTISVPYTTWSANGASYTCRNDNSYSYRVVSDASGNYSIVLLSYSSYALNISAPSGGQFSNAATTGYSVLQSKVQNIILNKTASEYKLSLSIIGSGSGSVSSQPTGISSVGQPVSWLFNAGTAIALTATPAPGSYFAGWTGACSGTETCTVTVNSELLVAASFKKIPKVSVTLNGTGAGSINGTPSSLACLSGTCTADLEPGEVVTLMAAPDSDSTFDGWQGACVNKSGNCTFTATEPASVSATFTKAAPVTLVNSARTPYSLIQSAYLAASTGDVIESRAGEFAEQLVFGRPITIDIEGGLDPSYSQVTGMSTISGFLKIRGGTVRMKNISIR